MRIKTTYICLFAIILISCRTTNKKYNNLNCDNYKSCNAVYSCYKSYFEIENAVYINDSININDLLLCTIKLAQSGNKDAHKTLLDYYKKSKQYYIKANVLPSNICKYYYLSAPKVFSKLRGKEAFELALEFAEKTDCIDTDDVVGGGNLGLNVIEYIIDPMIKSVGGEMNMRGYLNVDNYKNRSIKPTSSDPCQRAHEFTYGELVKAYKEGKILLKKYGED